MFSKEKALPGPSLDQPRNSQEQHGGTSFGYAYERKAILLHTFVETSV